MLWAEDRISLQKKFAIQAAVLYRLGDVNCLDPTAILKVGDSTGHLENSGHASCRKTQSLDG